jgi:uncharacterized protein (TIGR02996 family)
MDEPAFLRAIADRPDDDDLLLVYADWLEERGDGRAEFLRLLGAIASGAAFGEQPVARDRLVHRVNARLKRLRKAVDRGWAKQVIQLRSAAPLRFRIWRVHHTGGRYDPNDTDVYGILEAGSLQVDDKVELPLDGGKVLQERIAQIYGHNPSTISLQRHASGQAPLLLMLRFFSFNEWFPVQAPGVIRRAPD